MALWFASVACFFRAIDAVREGNQREAEALNRAAYVSMGLCTALALVAAVCATVIW